MSEQQKLGFISAVAAVALSIVTLAFTVGVIPYKAGVIIERVERLEIEVEQIDKIASDISYIRGALDVHISETKIR